jgi:DNA mismatch repair protein MutL
MDINKINVLPDNIANKIAAGEVVQRPDSAVKELMENALDAGAGVVEVVIKNAGKTLIRIIDDGAGMNEEDVRKSILRHSTSKIVKFEDLETLHTFGFRGEALASIAAVSQFEIRTQQKDEELGTLLKTEDGVNIKVEKGSFPVGTSVSAKNLFFNTPARRNFLKSNATELKHIIETFKRTALTNHAVSFKFYNDDDLIFDYPSASFEGRIAQVFAENIFDAVIEVKEITDFISLHGYIAKPSFLKKCKGEQYLFINDRYVLSKQINHAIYNAFDNLIDKGDYPFFVMFLTIDPKHVDVNVHPQKLEVKFDDDRDIYSFVFAVMKKAISSYDLVPRMSLENDEQSNGHLEYGNHTFSDRHDFGDRPVQKPFQGNAFPAGSSSSYPASSGGPRESRTYSDEYIDKLFGGLNPEIRSASAPEAAGHPFEKTQDSYRVVSSESRAEERIDTPFIVQLHNKYIIAQIRSGLMIIDQHVAHERILYERALNSFSYNSPFSQQLLFSQTFTLEPHDFAMLKELKGFLTKLGFEIKFFGKNTAVIDGVPEVVKSGTEEQIILDILDEYKKNDREKHLESKDNIAKSYSCKTAIKAGDPLTDKEMRQLVDELFATTNPYACPHGRPIVIKIPLEEFDKRFGRS